MPVTSEGRRAIHRIRIADVQEFDICLANIGHKNVLFRNNSYSGQSSCERPEQVTVCLCDMQIVLY